MNYNEIADKFGVQIKSFILNAQLGVINQRQIKDIIIRSEAYTFNFLILLNGSFLISSYTEI